MGGVGALDRVAQHHDRLHARQVARDAMHGFRVVEVVAAGLHRERRALRLSRPPLRDGADGEVAAVPARTLRVVHVEVVDALVQHRGSDQRVLDQRPVQGGGAAAVPAAHQEVGRHPQAGGVAAERAGHLTAAALDPHRGIGSGDHAADLTVGRRELRLVVSGDGQVQVVDRDALEVDARSDRREDRQQDEPDVELLVDDPGAEGDGRQDDSRSAACVEGDRQVSRGSVREPGQPATDVRRGRLDQAGAGRGTPGTSRPRSRGPG